MTISSRTPEGDSFRCSLCGEQTNVETSVIAGDACCPRCGQLLWWFKDRLAVFLDRPAREIDLEMALRLTNEADSLETVELVMQLEEEFDVSISDEAAEQIHTLADAIRFLRQQQRGQDA